MMENKLKKLFKTQDGRINVFQLLVFCHCLLSFVYERVLFTFSEDNFSIFQQVAIKETISDMAEMTLVYALTKVAGFLLIYAFWKAVFWGLEEIRVKKQYIFFIWIFLVILLLGFFMYPSTFALEIDNYANYIYAIHFLPTYWQSVFTGVLYGGCMMVIPHPFAVFLFQWLAFLFVMVQIYMFVTERYGDGTKLLMFFFFLPETIYLIFNAYRNNLYTILCMYYFLALFRLGVEKGEFDKLKEIPKLIFLTAFVMVWRGEGLAIGAAGLIFLVIFVYWKNVKQIMKLIAGCLVIFLLLSKIQGIGDEKYFGNDYMFINTTGVLYSILNDPEANLSYPGAEEDLHAIEEVVSVQALKEAGMKGYRNHNWDEGRIDFNQSFSTEEEASAYMKAYARIIMNNINDYMNVQVANFCDSMRFERLYEVYTFEGEPSEDIEEYEYNFWLEGQEAFRDSFFTRAWEQNGLRTLLFQGIWKVSEMWSGIWSQTGILAIVHGLSIMAAFYIFVYEVLQLLTKKDFMAIKRGWPFLIILGEYVLLLLVMPEGRPAYTYAMLYCSYLMIPLYYLEGKMEEKDVI